MPYLLLHNVCFATAVAADVSYRGSSSFYSPGFGHAQQVNDFVLYYATELPMSCAVQMAVREMHLPGLQFRRVNTLTMDQLKPPLQHLTPFGELPVLVHQGRE